MHLVLKISPQSRSGTKLLGLQRDDAAQEPHAVTHPGEVRLSRTAAHSGQGIISYVEM